MEYDKALFTLCGYNFALSVSRVRHEPNVFIVSVSGFIKMQIGTGPRRRWTVGRVILSYSLLRSGFLRRAAPKYS